MRQGRQRWWAVVVVLLAGALVVGGCSRERASRFTTVGARLDDKGASLTSGAGSSAADSATATSGSVPVGRRVGSQGADRQVVYRGSLTVKVGHAASAADEARSLAEDAGGYLARSTADLEGDQRVEVELRVPAEAFDETMAAVGDLGEVQARKVGSDDVTDQVVDLQERLRNAKVSAVRLRELLAKAENISNVIAIEDRLTQRETEIEQLTGQLEVLRDQVAMSTVTATLTEQDAPTVSRDLPGPLAALRAGGVAFVNVVLALVAATAFLLPFLVVLAIVVALWRRRRRRRRGHLPEPPAPPAAASADGESALGGASGPP